MKILSELLKKVPCLLLGHHFVPQGSRYWKNCIGIQNVNDVGIGVYEEQVCTRCGQKETVLVNYYDAYSCDINMTRKMLARTGVKHIIDWKRE